MNPPIKCERTHCFRDAVYIAEEPHPQGDGSVDVEHRATCEIHSKDHLPDSLSPLSEWDIIQ
jgi:hypothetical protein